jgi:hypothetical protein
MHLSPSPKIDPVVASDVGRQRRRALLDAAGDRADEVRSRGAGRYTAPADIVADADLSDIEDQLLIDYDRDELDHRTRRGARAIRDEEGLVKTAAEKKKTEPAPAEKSAQPSTADNEVTADDAPDPSDRDRFPNLASLKEYAATLEGLDLAGVTKRADIEKAVAKHLKTHHPA